MRSFSNLPGTRPSCAWGAFSCNDPIRRARLPAGSLPEVTSGALTARTAGRVPGRDPLVSSHLRRLPAWRHRIILALSLPAELARFLTEVGLPTSSAPATQLSVLLQAPRSLTEIIDPGDIKASLPPTWSTSPPAT
jgi:hypothetical protein